MSEAELHVLKARLIGGQRNKARRGELQMMPPIGLAYDSAGAVVLDPDEQVRASIQMIFDSFRQVGSACAVVRRFQREGLTFSAAHSPWRRQRRFALGRTEPQSRHPDIAQPSLYRCLRLRSVQNGAEH